MSTHVMLLNSVSVVLLLTSHWKLVKRSPRVGKREADDIAAEMALAMVEVGEKEEEDRLGKLNEFDNEEVIPCSPADDEPAVGYYTRDDVIYKDVSCIELSTPNSQNPYMYLASVENTWYCVALVLHSNKITHMKNLRTCNNNVLLQ